MVSDKMNHIEDKVCTKFENLVINGSILRNNPKVQDVKTTFLFYSSYNLN